MTETRRTFHQHLDEVKHDIMHLGALVTEGVPRATEVLLSSEWHGADELIAHDDVLDQLTASIEDRCFQLLATQQPMASDLRAIVTAIRLSSEIERSGDLVVNIVKGAGRIRGAAIDPRTRGLIQQLSEGSRRLFQQSIDAYADRDVVTAAALDLLDDQIDDLHRAFIQQVLESCRGGQLTVDVAVQLALIGRYYERISDHAVNIGQRVRYMVDGWMPAHGDGMSAPGTLA
ncbi:MAG: phosphate transport system protein [Acidimicrobiaceae bacterium]